MSQRIAVVALVVSGALGGLLPAASAKTGYQFKQLAGNSGGIDVMWDATSQQSFASIGGGFTHFRGIDDPRIELRMLTADNRTFLAFNRTIPGQNRRDEDYRVDLNQSYDTAVARVCMTLWERDGQIDTVCSNVDA